MIRRARGLAATGVLLVCALVGATLGGGTSAAAAASASTTTAVVVIDFSALGGPVRSELVDVGNGMNGLAVLSHVATVISYGYAGQGGAVCKIDGEGNEATASTCLVGPNSQYWAYFHSAGGAAAWSYSPVGAGNYTVHGGDVEGWRYGTGQKPAASANFCDYASCPEPPPPTTPAGGGDGGGSGGGQGTPSGGGGSGAGAAGSGATAGSGSGGGTATGAGGAGASNGGTGDAATGDSAQVTATTVVPSSDGRGDAATSKNGDDVRAEATSLNRGGSDDGSGSPMGVVVAAGLLAVVAATAVWLRRRARAPG